MSDMADAVAYLIEALMRDRWVLQITGPGQLGAMEKPSLLQSARSVGRISPTMYLLAHIPYTPSKGKARDARPQNWYWCPHTEDTIVVTDSSYHPVQRTKVNQQFKDDLNGQHRRAPAAPHSNPLATPGAPIPRTFAPHAISPNFAAVTRKAFIPRGALSDEPPKPVENAGIRTGEIIAYRCWIVDHDGYLRSTYMPTVWRPGEPMTGELETNVPECHAWGLEAYVLRTVPTGVHAFKTPDDVKSYIYSPVIVPASYSMNAPAVLQFAMCLPTSVVVGLVELWGEVIEHAHGYRATHAAPYWIFDHPERDDVPELRERYGLKHHGKSCDSFPY